jgi:electron transport complex protein RnfD
MLSGIAGAVVADALARFVLKKNSSPYDFSAALTGLLLSLCLPPHIPPWTVALGGFFAIAAVRELSGGFGKNVFNPALGGWAFLMMIMPIAMTSGWERFSADNVLASGISIIKMDPGLYDAVTGATPLTLAKNAPRLLGGRWEDVLQALYSSSGFLKAMIAGGIGGAIGETSAVCILAGGIILLAKRTIAWHIPVFFIGTAAACTAGLYMLQGHYPSYLILQQSFSGGIMLGAFFFATDPVTTPLSRGGRIIFGIGCGLICFALRRFSTMPDGTCFAILLMNATVPFIDRFLTPRVFGQRRFTGKNRKKQGVHAWK